MLVELEGSGNEVCTRESVIIYMFIFVFEIFDFNFILFVVRSLQFRACFLGTLLLSRNLISLAWMRLLHL